MDCNNSIPIYMSPMPVSILTWTVRRHFMTLEEKCDKCGKNIRRNKAGTITQWLKTTNDCECDNREQLAALLAEDERLLSKCPKCGKVREATREGSLTQWIFKDSRCKCDWDELGIEFDAGQTERRYRAEPVDDEIKALLKLEEIDYHGLACGRRATTTTSKV